MKAYDVVWIHRNVDGRYKTRSIRRFGTRRRADLWAEHANKNSAALANELLMDRCDFYFVIPYYKLPQIKEPNECNQDDL